MYAETRQGKRITVYVSGDRFHTGKTVNFNTHDIPVFERLCSFLTEHVPHPTGGCYRRIYTPNGTEIQGLEQIQSGNQYVASKDKFRRAGKDIRYTDIDKPRPHRKRGQFKKIDIDRIYTPVQHQHDPRLRNLHGRAKSLGEQKRAIILKVFLNGEFTDHARTVLITEPSKRSLKYLKEYIQDTLGTSEIRELYRVVNDGGRPENFSLITENDVTNLRNNEHILAVQNIRHLTPKRYNEKGCRNFTVHTSPRTGQASLYDPFPMPHSPPRNKGQFSKHKKLPGIGSSNQSQADTMSPYSNAPSHGGRRSDKSKGSRNNRDYDTDEGGVFKAKRQNNAQGAHQEEVHTKEKTTPIPPGTELNKRPSKEDKQNSDNVSQSKNKNEERVNEDAGQQ